MSLIRGLLKFTALLATITLLWGFVVWVDPWLSQTNTLLTQGLNVWPIAAFFLAAAFLGQWTETLGENLGVIDMGGPCNKSGFSDLNNFCRFADYYIASDLPNSGYTFDDWTTEKYNETSPELQYHRLFSDRSLSFEQALKGRIDLFQQAYEYARNHMIDNQVEQANYLYSCQKWPQAQRQVEQVLGDNHARINGDLVKVLRQKGADQSTLNALEGAIIHQADNRTFFDWPAEYSGFIDW